MIFKKPAFLLTAIFITTSEVITPKISLASTEFQQLVETWGYTVVGCSPQTSVLQNTVSGETICINPNSDLPLNKYLYNPANNEININSNKTPNPTSNNSSPRTVANPDSRIENVVFTFNSMYDYNNCLDEILLIYEQRLKDTGRLYSFKTACAENIYEVFGSTLTQEQLIAILELANFRATNLLDFIIYPAYGLRRRIKQLTGYVYDVDGTN